MAISVNDMLITTLKNIAQQAGSEVLKIYNQKDMVVVTKKKDQSPLTKADLRANEIIIHNLYNAWPNYPILSEESIHPPLQERRQWQYYWLVDPLDGTQEFIKRNGQFTVNIALMQEQYPLFGLIYVPVADTLYWGGRNLGSFKQTGTSQAYSIITRPIPKDKQTIVLSSRSYNNIASSQFIKTLYHCFGTIESVQVGSSLKGCKIAEGSADLYPRLGSNSISEWDTAAMQAIVEGAGGAIFDVKGSRFKYNYKNDLKNDSFIVVGDLNLNWQQFWNEGCLTHVE